MIGALGTLPPRARPFLAEALGTFALVVAGCGAIMVVVAVISYALAPAAAGLAIGGTVALASLLGGAISGASMNPARSLGPALASGDMRSLWIYLTAPLVGGVVGAAAYRAMGTGAPATEPDGRAA